MPTHDSDHTVFLLWLSFVWCTSTVFQGKRSQLSSWLHSPVTSSFSLCQLLADVQDRSLYPPYLQGQNGQPSIWGVCLQDKKGGKSKVWGPPHRRASSPTQMPPDTTPSTGSDLVHPSGHELLVVHGQPQELPHLFLGLGKWTGCDGCCFLHLWVHLSAGRWLGHWTSQTEVWRIGTTLTE